VRILLLLAALAQAGAAPVAVVGEFSNMRYTAEHAYGYTVQLWREGDRLFGLFLCSEGLAGDTPTGMRDAVEADPATGKLSFRAKLTTGVAYLGAGQEAPSRDLFEFRRRLEKTVLAGRLTKIGPAPAEGGAAGRGSAAAEAGERGNDAAVQLRGVEEVGRRDPEVPRPQVVGERLPLHPEIEAVVAVVADLHFERGVTQQRGLLAQGAGSVEGEGAAVEVGAVGVRVVLIG
jgi:hypothetical protein